VSAAAPKLVWSLPGQAVVARAFARALGCEAHAGDEAPECDVAHVVGVYDCPTFATTLRATARANRRVFHWLGPDAANRFWPDRLPQTAVHVAATPSIQRLLAAHGVEAAVVAPPVLVHAPASPFAPGAPVVAVYGGADPSTYGMSMVQALYECLPGVQFMSYGRDQFAEELMPQAIARARVYVRLRAVEDAGVSAREYLAAGRRVVCTQDVEHAAVVARDDLPGALAAVKRALSFPMPDAKAAAYWSAVNRDERFASEMERVMA
jgi:hypothetical protein